MRAAAEVLPFTHSKLAVPDRERLRQPPRL